MAEEVPFKATVKSALASGAAAFVAGCFVPVIIGPWEGVVRDVGVSGAYMVCAIIGSIHACVIVLGAAAFSMLIFSVTKKPVHMMALTCSATLTIVAYFAPIRPFRHFILTQLPFGLNVLLINGVLNPFFYGLYVILRCVGGPGLVTPDGVSDK